MPISAAVASTTRRLLSSSGSVSTAVAILMNARDGVLYAKLGQLGVELSGAEPDMEMAALEAWRVAWLEGEQAPGRERRRDPSRIDREVNPGIAKVDEAIRRIE